VPVRLVFVHDLTGTHRDEYFFTTRVHMPPRSIVEAYTERWAIEVAFEEARAYLGFGTTKGRSPGGTLSASGSTRSLSCFMSRCRPEGRQEFLSDGREKTS
jgi:hypothetical protein